MPPLVLDGQLRYRMFLLRCFRFVVEDMEEAGAQRQEVDVAGDSVNRGTGRARPGRAGTWSCLGRGLASRGAPGIKKPPPGQATPEGVCQHTRRLDTIPHGALRSREASPSQRSSLQGILPHGSSYQEALGFHTASHLRVLIERPPVPLVKRIDSLSYSAPRLRAGPDPYPCISAPAFGRCIRSQRVTSAAMGCSGDPS